MVYKLVLLRHGQSVWNLERRFTGWADVGLSPLGLEEARRAGKILHDEGFYFDLAYTSLLKRAVKTLWTVLEEMDLMWIPVHKDWRLNERHYGDLQGMDREEVLRRYGLEQVQLWRRGYDALPPALDLDDPRHPRFDLRYAALFDPPKSESLKTAGQRLMPYWHEAIAPAVLSGKRVIVVSHGNSLRALVKHLSGLSDDEVVKVNIPTGVPMVYELDDGLRPVRRYYLGDPKEVEEAVEAVKEEYEN